MVVPAIIDFFKSINEQNRTAQAMKLAHYIDELGDLMKQEVSIVEVDIRRTIVNALK